MESAGREAGLGLCGGRVFTRPFPVPAGASRCAAAWEGAVLTFGFVAILAEGGVSSVTQQAGPFLPPLRSVHPLPLPCTHSESRPRGQTRHHSSPRNSQSSPAVVGQPCWKASGTHHAQHLTPMTIHCGPKPTCPCASEGEAAVGTAGRWQQPYEHAWSVTSQMWWGRMCVRAKSLSVQLFVNL